MLFTDKIGISPRNLRETVSLVRRRSVTDDHGMQALVDDCVCEGVPASVKMLSGYAKTNYYQTAEIEAYEVRLRYTPHKCEGIIWGGRTLSVDSREDVGGRHLELRVLCSNKEVV